MFPYHNLLELINMIDDNGGAYNAILNDHWMQMCVQPGSSHNHQAWEGGYVHHVVETMNIAVWLYWTSPRKLPFTLSHALEVMFLHDIEKVFSKQLKGKFTWHCSECGFRNEDGEVAVKHYVTDHNGDESVARHGAIYRVDLYSKAERKAFRAEFIKAYGIKLTEVQENALKYVEGVSDAEYTPGARTMGELAAFCHCCDIMSARLWHDKGQEEKWEI